MLKDYVKHEYKINRRVAEQGWLRRLLLVLVPLLLLVAVGYGIYVYKNAKPDFSKISVSVWINDIRSFMNHSTLSARSSASSTPAPSVQEKSEQDDIQFNFYTELANRQVMVDEVPEATPAIIPVTQAPASLEKEPTPIQKKPSTTAAVDTYVLQLAAFKNQTAAGEMRVTLLLDGLSATIVKTEVNDAVIYLVQQGPYSSLTEVKSMQKKLKQKGIESVIKKAE